MTLKEGVVRGEEIYTMGTEVPVIITVDKRREIRKYMPTLVVLKFISMA
jgi:PII-like signaling protein